jgi:hypothetical protein
MASNPLKRFRGLLISGNLFLTRNGCFCWGFCDLWVAERGFLTVNHGEIRGKCTAGSARNFAAKNAPDF